MIHLDSSLQYTSADVNYSRIQLGSELKYMKERYKEMHNIKYEKELDIGSAAHIRVYRNRGKNLIAVHPFLMSNLEAILAFVVFLVACCLRCRSPVKILVEVIQFPVKPGEFFLGSFIGIL